MTSKIIVNTIEADTGISSVTFASNINLQNDSSILVSSSGIRLGTGSTIAAPSANEIALSTNSAERVRITSAGNLGIGGLTNPGALLSIPAGESNTPRLAIESAVDDNDFTITQYEDGNGTYTMLGQNVKLNSGGNNTILDSAHRTAGILLDARNHGSIVFLTGGANAVGENVKIDSSGNVGIGTDIIQANTNYNTLEIVGDAGTTGGGIVRLKTGNLAAKTMLFCDTGGFEARVETNHPFVISTNNTERLRIDSSGFIKQKFTSNNSTTAEGLFINNLNNGTGNNASLILSNDSGERKKAAIALIDTGNYGAGDLVFALDGADSGELHLTNDEKLRITSDGKVGINETSPNGSLHIGNLPTGSGNLNVVTLDRDDGTLIYGIDYNGSSNLVSFTGNNKHFAFANKSGAAETVRIDSSGNVNIGANGSSNPFTYLRFGASQYGAADIRPINEGSHKVGLAFYTDGTQDTTINPTERLRITSAGYVLKSDTPAFKCKLSGATGANFTGVLVFNSVQYNIGSHYNSSNGRFTAPVDGRYLFCWYTNMERAGGNGSFYADWRINGNNQGNRMYTHHSGAWEQICGTIIFDLNTNDYVEINAITSGNWDGGSYGSYSGYLLG